MVYMNVYIYIYIVMYVYSFYSFSSRHIHHFYSESTLCPSAVS